MKKRISFLFLLILIVFIILFNNKNSDNPAFAFIEKEDYLEKFSKTNPVYDDHIQEIINSTIRPEMTEYDKVKAIHDYIIINTSYDTQTNLPDSSFSPEGVLEKGIAVCQGYAETFQLFMNKLGIESEILIGSANDISHAWNVVRIDGEWYNVDVTWDDPIVENQVITGSDNLSYTYFLKPDEFFSKTHIANKPGPSCTSNKYLYIEQYNNIPYTILNTVNDIPTAFMQHYYQGVSSLTMYFPEDINPADTEILTALYKNLRQGEDIISFKYYPVKRFLDYSYITIFIELRIEI